LNASVDFKWSVLIETDRQRDRQTDTYTQSPDIQIDTQTFKGPEGQNDISKQTDRQTE